MKKKIPALVLAALLLTGCRGGESSAPRVIPEGITLHTDEDVSSEYAETVKAYFAAVEQNDFEAYAGMVHPVYLSAFRTYLEEQKDSSPEENFARQHKRFDEDGYDSWRITDLTLSVYQEPDYDYYFKQFTDAGILTEEQVQTVRDSAEEMQDLKFSVDVLYEGDTEPVTVFRNQQMILFKTADGIRIFG